MGLTVDRAVVPAPWLWTPRTKPIRLLEIHSTRGGSTNEYGATCGWMKSSNNGGAAQGWGGSCSWIIAEDGRLCQVLQDDQMPTYGAGYGGRGSTYAIDEYGIAVEWCQARIGDPFTEAQYQAGADLYAHYCEKYDIPPVMLSIPRQTGEAPTGFIRHDRCENGSKLGKSDPGPQFREDYFVALVQERLRKAQPIETQGEDDMPLSQEDLDKIGALIDARLKRLIEDTADIHGWLFAPSWVVDYETPDNHAKLIAKAVDRVNERSKA